MVEMVEKRFMTRANDYFFVIPGAGNSGSEVWRDASRFQ